MDLSIRSNIKSVLDIVVKQLTELGSITILGIIILFACFYNFDLAIRLFIGIVSATIIATIIKALFFKERPNKQKKNTLVEKIDASSFPSVHSSRIAILGFWLCMYSTGVLEAVFISVVCFLVACSRVYLKKHYWIDVLGGVVLAVIINFIIYKILGLGL
jgi:membrane-associated phospholipid phosphatase